MKQMIKNYDLCNVFKIARTFFYISIAMNNINIELGWNAFENGIK